MAATLNRCLKWLRGFAKRLLYSCQLIAFCPMLLLLFLLAPLWWLLTGTPMPYPAWIDRVMDDQG